MDNDRLTSVCRRLVAYLETGVASPDLFTADVFCDFTPPLWRVQAAGVHDVLEIRRRGHPTPGNVPRWTALPTPTGFVMELEERWTDENDDWYCREAIVAETRGEAISRLAVYCTGDWNGVRQAAHAAHVTLLEP
jgi:hypothetical protein